MQCGEIFDTHWHVGKCNVEARRCKVHGSLRGCWRIEWGSESGE